MKYRDSFYGTHASFVIDKEVKIVLIEWFHLQLWKMTIQTGDLSKNLNSMKQGYIILVSYVHDI